MYRSLPVKEFFPTVHVYCTAGKQLHIKTQSRKTSTFVEEIVFLKLWPSIEVGRH